MLTMFRGVKLEDPAVSAFRRELLTRWQRQREAEAARAAVPATVVAAKGRRAQASAAVSERARPAAAPSPFRALRPGDRIVMPPSLTTPRPTSTTPTPLTIPHGPEPVAAVLDRRQTAVAKMAAWHRGDGPGASATPRLDPGAAPVPTAHAIKRTEPEPVADLFARRRAVVKAARPWIEGGLTHGTRNPRRFSPPHKRPRA